MAQNSPLPFILVQTNSLAKKRIVPNHIPPTEPQRIPINRIRRPITFFFSTSRPSHPANSPMFKGTLKIPKYFKSPQRNPSYETYRLRCATRALWRIISKQHRRQIRDSLMVWWDTPPKSGGCLQFSIGFG